MRMHQRHLPGAYDDLTFPQLIREVNIFTKFFNDMMKMRKNSNPFSF